MTIYVNSSLRPWKQRGLGGQQGEASSLGESCDANHATRKSLNWCRPPCSADFVIMKTPARRRGSRVAEGGGLLILPAHSCVFPMMRLYSRLFKYAPLPQKTSLENFLTESLCDLLERITATDRRNVEKFAADLFLGSTKSGSALAKRLRNAQSLRWCTQYRVKLGSHQGWADLCLLGDEKVLLLIENKVNAPDSLFTRAKMQIQANPFPNWSSTTVGCVPIFPRGVSYC